jgi:hypothetical protein
MERFLVGQSTVQLSTKDFATQLRNRLAPFFNQETFFVMDRTPSKESQFALFIMGDEWNIDCEWLDFKFISASIGTNAVSSRNYVPLEYGRLMLFIGNERLNAHELDVVTIEILRKFAGTLVKESQWPSD